MSVLLAFDQSSKISGYAVFVDDKLSDYGKFIFEDADIDIRLHKIRNKVAELIDLYKPDNVVYEDIQQQENVQTFKVLAEVYGVIGELLQELAIPHYSILASSWKSTLDIKGRNRAEQKKSAQQYIIKNYGITPIQDVCDAICIGLHHIKKHKCAWAK